jgi:hypothetical protein
MVSRCLSRSSSSPSRDVEVYGPSTVGLSFGCDFRKVATNVGNQSRKMSREKSQNKA